MVETNRSNPNGANQFNLDPRQALCWEYYVNPNSETFGNALQSALRAGYEQTYATQLTATEWFKDKVRRLNILQKAEKVLDKALSYDVEDPETGKVMTDLLRIQTDVAKYSAERLGKENYSNRTELTGKEGKDLIPQPILDVI